MEKEASVPKIQIKSALYERLSKYKSYENTTGKSIVKIINKDVTANKKKKLTEG